MTSNKYEKPAAKPMDISLDPKETAGTCRSKSSNCGHGDNGCMLPQIEEVQSEVRPGERSPKRLHDLTRKIQEGRRV